jgi:hypothetical protein
LTERLLVVIVIGMQSVVALCTRGLEALEASALTRGDGVRR